MNYWPRAANVKVNMMPFKMGDWTTMPLRQYIFMIQECAGDALNGEVCYLTVTESFVEKGKSQRRPGPHTEATDLGSWGNSPWGEKNLWMGSTVANTLQIWPEEIKGVGVGGVCSGMKSKPFTLKSGEVIRISDKTPHEALPMEESGYRQFFRLVGPDIFGWYSQHSTANPLCPLPEGVKIITENKFQ